MRADIQKYCVTPDISVRNAVAQMDDNHFGAMLVVDGDRRLLGIVTDGDIRRAILAGTDFGRPVSAILEAKKSSDFATPVCAQFGLDPQHYLDLFTKYSIFHLPIVDEDGRVTGLVTVDDFLPHRRLPIEAVVMAGGKGNRLRPLTVDTPKPLLPVGDKPIMERIIEQLSQSGIKKVNITTHYKGELISQHFRDGKDFGVEIQYVQEDSPLGTAGALSLLQNPQEPLLVINGDVMTRVDFRRMYDFHREHRADMTVAVRQCDFKVPYGVVESDGVRVVSVSEKPVVRRFINAGIYLINPDVCGFLGNGEPCEMPDLINRLIQEGRRIISFPVREYWIDIGQKDQYDRAQEDLKVNSNK